MAHQNITVCVNEDPQILNCDRIFMCLSNANNIASGLPYVWGKALTNSWADQSSGNWRYYFDMQISESVFINPEDGFDFCTGDPVIITGCLAKALGSLFEASTGATLKQAVIDCIAAAQESGSGPIFDSLKQIIVDCVAASQYGTGEIFDAIKAVIYGCVDSMAQNGPGDAGYDAICQISERCLAASLAPIQLPIGTAIEDYVHSGGPGIDLVYTGTLPSPDAVWAVYPDGTIVLLSGAFRTSGDPGQAGDLIVTTAGNAPATVVTAMYLPSCAIPGPAISTYEIWNKTKTTKLLGPASFPLAGTTGTLTIDFTKPPYAGATEFVLRVRIIDACSDATYDSPILVQNFTPDVSVTTDPDDVVYNFPIHLNYYASGAAGAGNGCDPVSKSHYAIYRGDGVTVIVPQTNIAPNSVVNFDFTTHINGGDLRNADPSDFDFMVRYEVVDACGSKKADHYFSITPGFLEIFDYTGGDQATDAPLWSTSADVTAFGASGFESVYDGGTTVGTVAITPGNPYMVVVGKGGETGDTQGDAYAVYGFGSLRGGGLSGLFTGSATVAATDKARALVVAGGGGTAGIGLTVAERGCNQGTHSYTNSHGNYNVGASATMQAHGAGTGYSGSNLGGGGYSGGISSNTCTVYDGGGNCGAAACGQITGGSGFGGAIYPNVLQTSDVWDGVAGLANPTGDGANGLVAIYWRG